MKEIDGMKRGEVIHKLAELKLDKELGKLVKGTKEWNDSIREYKEISRYIDDDIEETADLAVQQILDLYGSYGTKAFMITEGFLYSSTKKSRADAYIVSEEDKLIHIIDIKTGGAYDAYEPNNEQFLHYAAGALNLYSRTIKDIRGIRITVINGVNSKSGSYSKEGIEKWDKIQKQRMIESISNPIALMMLEVVDMVNNMEPSDVDEEILYAVGETNKVRDKVYTLGQKFVDDEGGELEGYETVYRESEDINEELFVEYIMKKGIMEKAFKVMKPQQGRIDEHLNEEEVNEIEELGVFGTKINKKSRRLSKF